MLALLKTSQKRIYARGLPKIIHCAAAMPPKKRTSSVSGEPASTNNTRKRGRIDLTTPHPNAQQAEDFGIVLREFYPPEMRNERCEAYNDGTLERPIETLEKAYEATTEGRQAIRPGSAVVHWFKSDLRLHDNRALYMASEMAREHKIPLICLYVLSPEDLTAHLISAARVDLTLRILETLKKDLGEIDIPLYMETQDHRRDIPCRIVDLCQRWGANHLFSNIEYEVDELRRDAKLIYLCAENGIKFEAAHDTCVVTPGNLHSQQGKPYAVYSPWYRAWLAFLKENPEYLEVVQEPGSNPGDARSHFGDLFNAQVPAAPTNKQLSDEQKSHFQQLYPASEHEALCRLEGFLEDKAKSYNDLRNLPAGQHTSVLSPYFASGSLSARTAVSMAKQANRNSLEYHEPGHASWISEVAWRDFYRHVLVHWPFIW